MKKEGISIMIGYVLLVVFALLMGTIVYNIIKTYVPKDVPMCPEGVSIFASEIEFSTDYELSITITNNGLFDIGGYFIWGSDSDKGINTKSLSGFLKTTKDTKSLESISAVVFLGGDANPMKPNDKKTQIFDIGNAIKSIEITPIRFQKENENGKEQVVSCGDSKIRESVSVNI